MAREIVTFEDGSNDFHKEQTHEEDVYANSIGISLPYGYARVTDDFFMVDEDCNFVKGDLLKFEEGEILYKWGFDKEGWVAVQPGKGKTFDLAAWPDPEGNLKKYLDSTEALTPAEGMVAESEASRTFKGTVADLGGWLGKREAQPEDMVALVIAPSSDASIDTLSIGESRGSVDGKTKIGTVAVNMPDETDITSLEPEITLTSHYAVYSPKGPQDFTKPVTYTVVAEDGLTTREWAVTVTLRAAPPQVSAGM